MTSVRTPAMLVSSILTGYSWRASAESFFRQASVATRLSASVCGWDFPSESEASHFCASGLTVDGMGITRLTCAVPSESKLEEFACGAGGDGAAAVAQIASPATATQQQLGSVMPTFVTDHPQE